MYKIIYIRSKYYCGHSAVIFFERKFNLKRILKIIPVLIFVFFVGTAIGIKAQTNELSDKIVRFHIVADSNSNEAQKVKWEIRKEIFEKINLENISSKDDALLYFESEKENIKNIADSILKKNNLLYESEVYIGKKEFPVREYNSFILPAGIYDTISVNLGSGKGKNFFCVMYPSLCMVSSVSEKTDECPELLGSVLTEKEKELVTDMSEKTVVKFKIVEMFDKFISK